MSSPKPSKAPSSRDVKVGVQISRETGGAYVDINEVIDSELARIRAERTKTEQAENEVPRNGNQS